MRRKIALSVVLGLLMVLAWIAPPIIANLFSVGILIFTVALVEVALTNRDETYSQTNTIKALQIAHRRQLEMVTKNSVAITQLRNMVDELDEVVSK